MIITLIVDSYDTQTNGTSMTTRRFAEVLIQHGHTVRVAASTVSNIHKDNAFELGIRKTPILYQVAKSQGFHFAKKNKKALKKAIEGSDVVHFLLPFKAQRYGKKICDKLGIASTAAFHLQPQNITSTLHLNNIEVVNKMIYSLFKGFYDKFDHVHCPSAMIAEQLRKNNYKSNLHVISNGVSSVFKKLDVKKPEKYADKFVILMVGRYSVEKRQDLIIKAIAKSKYEKNIQLVLAGQGPWRRHLEDLSKQLTNKPIFGFYSQTDLLQVINQSDLYVHASDAEIEGISCIEAFSCGLVPIISDSSISATSQFSIDDHNSFKRGDHLDLRDKIDYYIENPEEKAKRSLEYLELSKKYSLDSCVMELEAVFEKAIKDMKAKNQQL